MSKAEPGSWALILGASGGFGAATARALAGEGWNIFGVHLDRRAGMKRVAALQQELEGLGVQQQFFNVNACDEAKRSGVLDTIQERLAADGGRVQVLMHSLAFGTLRPYLGAPKKRMSRKQFDMTMDVMANSLVYWTQGLVERSLIGPGGSVFAMTSAGAITVTPDYGAVSAAKCALEAHVRQLAFELRGDAIKVNAVCAGVTDTDALRKIPGHGFLKGRAMSKSGFRPPRLCSVEEVAAAIAALTDPRLALLTGNTLAIDNMEMFVA